MKGKTFIILFLTLFISSCSIDWNDEKGKKIQEIEKRLEEIELSTYSAQNMLCGIMTSEFIENYETNMSYTELDIRINGNPILVELTYISEYWFCMAKTNFWLINMDARRFE